LAVREGFPGPGYLLRKFRDDDNRRALSGLTVDRALLLILVLSREYRPGQYKRLAAPD
jgi:hypothetical protein